MDVIILQCMSYKFFEPPYLYFAATVKKLLKEKKWKLEIHFFMLSFTQCL